VLCVIVHVAEELDWVKVKVVALLTHAEPLYTNPCPALALVIVTSPMSFNVDDAVFKK
jgi:hypothetical protein